MQPESRESFILQDPDAQLARMFLEQYLAGKGYAWKEICRLPEDRIKQLMIEASTFASVKLAEIRDKAEFVRNLRGTLEPARRG